MKKYCFLLAFLCLFFTSCHLNERYIILKAELEGNTKTPPYSYLIAYKNEEFACNWYYVPDSPKKQNIIFTYDSSLFELKSIDTSSNKAVFLPLTYGSGIIKIQNNNTCSTTLLIDIQ